MNWARLWKAAVLAAFLFFSSHAQAKPSPEELIFSFYKQHYSHLEGYNHVAESAFWLRYYARLAGIEEHLETLLCIAHRESAFDPSAKSAHEDSRGFMQTRARYEPRLRRWWAARGVRFPSHREIQAQAAFGVAEFREHWLIAHGNVDEALGRYNAGKNWDGRLGKRYRRRVLLSRKIIFNL